MFLDAATLVSSIRQFMEFQLRDAISANTLLCVPTWAQNQRRALYVPVRGYGFARCSAAHRAPCWCLVRPF